MHNYAYQIGDKVVIKPDFYMHRYDGDPGINGAMKLMAGKEVTIKRQCAYRRYNVWENEWTWDERWFDPPYPDFDVPEDEFIEVLKD